MTTIAGHHDRPGLAVDSSPITGEMPDLLEIAVEAHGGLARWNKVSSVKIDLSIGGAVWYVKGQPDVLKDIVMVADTERERVTTSFVGQDRTTIFEPDRVVVQRSDGTILEASDDPEASFEGQEADSPWNAIHVAYFSGEALVDLSQYAVPLYTGALCQGGDRLDRSRRRDVAAAKGDLPRGG